MTQPSVALISHRVSALAFVSLTRRSDLVVEEVSEMWEVEMLARLGPLSRRQVRLLGVAHMGTAKMLTSEEASRELNGYFRAGKQRASVQYPFPVIGLIFSMETDEGFFAWRSKPLIRDSTPALELQESLHCKEFTRAALDDVIDRTNAWYDALFSLLVT